MAAVLSLDLRERVIAAIEAGASCRQTAERFGIGAASAIRWYARFREEGEIAANRWAVTDTRIGWRLMPS